MYPPCRRVTVYMESTESLTPTRTFELNSIYLLHAALYRNYTEVGGVRVGVGVGVRVKATATRNLALTLTPTLSPTLTLTLTQPYMY